MAKATIDESAQALKALRGSGPLEGVYLFYGEDFCLIDQLVESVARKRFKGGEIDPLSWDVYHAGETSANDVINSVRTISMFGGAKVVVYRGIEKLNEADLQRLVAYASSPVRAHLVLVASRIDMRKKSWSSLKKSVYAVSCMPLTERNMASYVRESSHSRSMTLTSDGIDSLCGLIGPDRALLERALDKLALAVSPETTITPEIVEQYVVDTRERSVFELTNDITKRNIPGALSALRTLLSQGQEAIAINGMLARHARMLLQVKLGQARRMSDDAIAEQIGVKPYFMRDYAEGARHYSLSELYKFHARVYDVDRTLKSKPVPAELALSELLMSLLKTP